VVVRSSKLAVQRAVLVCQPSSYVKEREGGGEEISAVECRALFPPTSRLLTPSQYRALFKGGKRISSRGLTLIVKPNNLNHARLGMTIPKRLVKRAVDRNAIKRRIRESFRHMQLKLHGIDVVVMANSGISKVSNQQVFDLVNPLWYKVAKLKWEDS